MLLPLLLSFVLTSASVADEPADLRVVAQQLRVQMTDVEARLARLDHEVQGLQLLLGELETLVTNTAAPWPRRWRGRTYPDANSLVVQRNVLTWALHENRRAAAACVNQLDPLRARSAALQWHLEGLRSRGKQR